MRASGRMASKRVKASGRVYLVIRILVSGFSRKLMGMVCTSGRMVIDMRANGIFASNTGKDLISSLTAMFTQVNTKTANHTVSANTSGRIHLSMLVHFKVA